MATFLVVDIIPNSHSSETNQDSETSIGVNPANPSQLVISAFTLPDSGQTNGPVFISQDSGSTWNLAFIAPGGESADQTYAFGGISGEFYGGFISRAPILIGGSANINALSTPNAFVPGTMAILETDTGTDQPFIVSTTRIRDNRQNGSH
jgi:hypothetical protein